MASIGGLVSGLDTATIISQLLQIEARPQVGLQRRVSSEQRSVNALQTLNAKLATVATKAADLASMSGWTPMKATSTHDKVVVSATPSASPATLAVNVGATATPTTAIFSSTATKDAVVTAANTVITVVRDDGTSATFNTGSGSLADVAAAVNDPANATGLQATLVKAGGTDAAPTYRMHIVAKSTGAASGFSLDPGLLGGVVTGASGSADYAAATSTITIPAPPAATFTIHFLDSTTSNIDYSNAATLGEVVTRINSANAGVTAALVGPVGAQRLHLTSDDGRAFTLEQTGSVASPFQAASTSAGSDASVTVNGSVLTSASNTLVGLMPGVDVTLLPGATGPTTITVSHDSASMSDKVKALVDAVNYSLDDLTSLTAYNPTTKTAGLLSGESSLRQLRDGLLASVTAGFGGTSLAAVGIQTDKTGKLVFDAAKFQAAYTADPTGTAEKFAGTITWTGAGTVELKSATWRTAPGAHTVDAVANTVGGLTGTRTGDILTGASAPPVGGLSLTVSAGAQGSLTYVQGLAAKLEAMAQRASDSMTGTVSLAVTSRNSAIKGWEGDIAEWDVRLAARRTTLERQYTALETALSKLQSQSTWLAGQINSLPKISADG